MKRISVRLLRKWRAEALRTTKSLQGYDGVSEFTVERRKQSNRILCLTQELLDLGLLNSIKLEKN